MTIGLAVAIVSVFLMALLIYLGMHIGVVLTTLSFVGVWIIRGNFDIACNLLSLAVADSISDYNFAVIPLFVLMGNIVSASELGRDLFEVTNWMFRRFRGGLGVSTVVANAGFAAVTGVSIASASVFTKIAVPEMLRFGFDRSFAVGIVAGSSVLGMLIPPSVLMILYGILTDVSIGSLFIAGIVPGVTLALAFSFWILGVAYFRPHLVGGTTAATGPAMTLVTGLLKLFPVAALITLVIGGIYGGLFTATEAAGVGASGSLFIALLLRRLTWRLIWLALVDTATVTASICFLLIAASLYSRMLAYSGMPSIFAAWVETSGLPLLALLGAYIAVLLFLGCILDSASIMLITVPVMAPVLIGLHADPIWLGIIIVVAVEVGLITPPLGISVFVVHDTLNDHSISINDIFRGVWPFVVVMVAVLAVLVAFPQLVLILL